MAKTQKLYYKDIHQIEFDAHILEISQDVEQKLWKVELDQTCFYPEGGGQPADKGWLNGVEVIDVQKDGDSVYHYLKNHPGNGAVKGKIDAQWRSDFMQQHTGQHIISGALWRVGQYKTVSVHMGLEYTTIEIEAPDISETHLQQTEDLANRVIMEDLPIQPIHTTKEEVSNYPLRKPTGRSGDIRLVKIGDFDCVACGGLHLDTTRKVQLVKATSVEKIRGNTRITWKIGARALRDYRHKDHIISELKPLLATREDFFPQKTKEILEELSFFKKKYGQLENRLAETIAQDLFRNRRYLQGGETQLITASWEGADDLLIKKIMKQLLAEKQLLICLVNEVSGGAQLRWSVGCSEDVEFPFDKVKNELLSIIDGKGGGRHPLWQGSGNNPGGLERFFKAIGEIASAS